LEANGIALSTPFHDNAARRSQCGPDRGAPFAERKDASLAQTPPIGAAGFRPTRRRAMSSTPRSAPAGALAEASSNGPADRR